MSNALTLLPWQTPWLSSLLGQVRGHAVLIHGEHGAGQLPVALALAKAWLCEAPQRLSADGQVYLPACGACAACHLFEHGYHPDVQVVMPQELLPELGWVHVASADGEEPGEGKKKKPSREIKVDSVREAVAFCQSTASRGRAKVVLVHPAQAMNAVAANTLLKTLEEPPGGARFVLTCDALDEVLPTVRSRCQPWRLPLPDADTAAAWLVLQVPSGKGDGLSQADARMLLAAAGGSPLDALRLWQQGWTAAAWQQAPQDMQAGQASFWAPWPLPEVVGLQQKLCHDLACVQAGGSPRYFPAASLQGLSGCSPQRLMAWEAELRQAQRHARHPWSAGLKVQALMLRAQQVLRSSLH